MSIVEKIHSEIDTAQERILQEAIKIINETVVEKTSSLESKAERLKRLGFESALEVKEAEKIIETKKNKLHKIELSRKQAEYIQYYNKEYPFYKFLTEEELDRICNKYNLIYAPVNNYIKNIPEKNLKELEEGKIIKKEDIASNLVIWRYTEYYTKDCPKNITKTLKIGIPIPSNLQNRNNSKISIEMFGINYCQYDTIGSSFKIIDRSKLFIAAPKSHFDLKDLSKDKKSKFGFFNITKIEPKDPIVFQYVNGGILVKTKWGEEANDELLQLGITN